MSVIYLSAIIRDVFMLQRQQFHIVDGNDLDCNDHSTYCPTGYVYWLKKKYFPESIIVTKNSQLCC